MTIPDRFRALDEEGRQEAWELARQWVAGKQPDPNQFKTWNTSRYPRWIGALIVIASIIVLVAAFIPSAYRLHLSGASEFCKSVQATEQDLGVPMVTPDPGGIGGGEPLALSVPVFSWEARCVNVGAATVVLAETSQLVFLMALALFEAKAVTLVIRGRAVSFSPTHLILWTGAVLATMIAIVGNANIGEPWAHGARLFAYMETFIPPLIVMGIGYVLKEMFLHTIESRHEAKIKFLEAIRVYEAKLADPETQSSWLRFYSQALRESLKGLNKGLGTALLNAMTNEDWTVVVRHEMRMNHWTVDMNPPAQITPTTPVLLPAQDTPQADGTPPQEGDRIFQRGDQWFGKSRLDGWDCGPYKEEWHARNAVKNHNRQLAKKATPA